MRYENRFLLISLAIAGLALGGCKGSADDGDREADRDITVTCTSTVAYDVGACQILANARCEGARAQLRGVLSSTFLPANKLYQNSARYRCQMARSNSAND
jgi:7-keto-8-aminopelargonate synthetase-like enzyme